MRTLSHPPPGAVGMERRPLYCSSPPGSYPVQTISPLLVFTSEYSVFTVATCEAVRHWSLSAPLHRRVSGSKWHLLGSPIRPSFTPSRASQAASTALCSVSILAGERAPSG